MAKNCFLPPFNRATPDDEGPIVDESTVNWSVQSIGLSPEELAKGVTDEERKRLKKIVLLNNLKDGNAVMALAEGDESLAASFVDLADDVDRLPGDPAENRGRIMATLILIDEASKAADLATKQAERGGRRDTVEWGIVQPDMETGRKTMTYNLSASVFDTSPPRDSEPAPTSRNLRRAVLSTEPIKPGMSANEVANALTIEGGRMTRILFDEVEELISGEELGRLENKHNKRGFMTLAMMIREWMNSFPNPANAQRELIEALDVAQAEVTARIRKKLGGALFGKRQ